MNLQDARNCLQNLLNHLWNHPDRFTSGDIDELIQALEEFVIPLIDERIKMEEIAERYVGNISIKAKVGEYVMDRSELERHTREYCVDSNL